MVIFMAKFHSFDVDVIEVTFFDWSEVFRLKWIFFWLEWIFLWLKWIFLIKVSIHSNFKKKLCLKWTFGINRKRFIFHHKLQVVSRFSFKWTTWQRPSLTAPVTFLSTTKPLQFDWKGLLKFWTEVNCANERVCVCVCEYLVDIINSKPRFPRDSSFDSIIRSSSPKFFNRDKPLCSSTRVCARFDP